MLLKDGANLADLGVQNGNEFIIPELESWQRLWWKNHPWVIDIFLTKEELKELETDGLLIKDLLQFTCNFPEGHTALETPGNLVMWDEFAGEITFANTFRVALTWYGSQEMFDRRRKGLI